jgi:ribosomal protein S18 acetylase RimI-like enzyme
VEATLPLAVRDGAPADAEAVEAVHWAGMEAAYRSTVAGWPSIPRDLPRRIATWREWLSDPRVVSLVASVSDRIVGLCTVRATEDEGLDSATVAEMPTLYVHPDAWHRGYGRRLCDEGVARARERGFAMLTLWVVESNARARAFYTEFGFAEDGARKVVQESPATVEALRFRLDLG